MERTTSQVGPPPAMPDLEEVRPGVRFGVPNGDQFEIGDELGRGTAARVFTCRCLRDDERLAVKAIDLRRLRLLGDFDAQMVKLNREVQILQELRHENIVNMRTVYKTASWCLLVMELVSGGELFFEIVQKKSLSEEEARRIFRQLLDGVGYMHAKCVIHRDLKPENILIAKSTPADLPATGNIYDVKVADFGLSKIISDGMSRAKTFLGTPQYWAPEVLNVQQGGGSYDQNADFWSLGAVLFVMLCGRYPFDGKKMPLEEQIRTATFNMNTAVWQRISDEAKDLVRGLLRVDPATRLGIEQCRAHPWVIGPEAVLAKLAKSAQICEGPRSAQSRTDSDQAHQAPIVAEKLSEAAPSKIKPMITQPSVESAGSVQSVQTPPAESPAFVKPWHGVNEKPAVAGFGPSSEQGIIFSLSELLNLQVSIAASLEMACLAFRHAEAGLADDIRRTFRQARDLSQHAANVVQRYAQTAEQVSQIVLPDLQLAVQENEASLAVSFLGMVKDWVVNMKKDGEEMQSLYARLQESVHSLIIRAQHTKSGADRRLADAVVEEVQPMEGAPPPVSPQLRPAPPPQAELAMCLAAPRSIGPVCVPASPPRLPPANSPNVVPQDNVMGGGTIAVPSALNSLTRQLFEQLNQQVAQTGGDVPKLADGDVPMLADGDGANTASKEEAGADAWKRDVLDLLFMSPGATSSMLPKVESFQAVAPLPRPVNGDGASEIDGAAEVDVEDVESEAMHVDGSFDASDPYNAGSGSAALVAYAGGSKSAADAATRSAAILLRALQELKRVDEILHNCSAFWANMDGTVQKLSQMKEHTELLVKYAASSKPLRERFEQRLTDYTEFWSSLERLCRRYCVDHQVLSKQMYKFISEVNDASDMIDTSESVRLGMLAALQGRHGGRMMS